jgi:hypothetical protein
LKAPEVLGIVDDSETWPEEFITNEQGEKVPNPEFSTWNKKDQYLLSWINMSLFPSVLSTIYGLHTSRQVWSSLSTRFASQSRSQVLHLKRQLHGLQQGSKSCTEYLRLAKSIADQLAAVGKPADDEDLISFIMSGLNPSFNSFITSYYVNTRDHSPTFANFQDDVLSHEMLLKQQFVATADTNSNFAFHMQRQGSNSSNSNRMPFQKHCSRSPSRSTLAVPPMVPNLVSLSQTNALLAWLSIQPQNFLSNLWQDQPSSLRLFPQDGLLLPGKAPTKSTCYNGCIDQQYP